MSDKVDNASGYSPFTDPDIPASTKRKWREKGGKLGGRRVSLRNAMRNLDAGDKIELRTYGQIIERAEWLATVLEYRELTTSEMRVYLDVLKFIVDTHVEKQAIEQAQEKIQEIEERLQHAGS